MTWALPAAWGGPIGGRSLPNFKPVKLPAAASTFKPVKLPVTVKAIDKVKLVSPNDLCVRLGPSTNVLQDMRNGLTSKTVNIQDALCPIFIFGEREQYSIQIYKLGVLSPSSAHTAIDIYTKGNHITYSLVGTPRNKVNLINLHADDAVHFQDVDPNSFSIRDNPRITSNACEVIDYTPEQGKKITTSRVIGDTICPKFTLKGSKTYFVYVSGGTGRNLRLNFQDGNGLNKSYDFNPAKLGKPIELAGFVADDYLNFSQYQYPNFKLPTLGHLTVPVDGEPCESRILFSNAMPASVTPAFHQCTLIHKQGNTPLTTTFAHYAGTDLSTPDLKIILNQTTTRITGGEIGKILIRTLGANDTLTLDTPAARSMLRTEGNPSIDAGPNAGIDCGSTTYMNGIGQIHSCLSTCDVTPDPIRSSLYNGPDHQQSWTYTCRANVAYGPVTKCELSTAGSDFKATYWSDQGAGPGDCKGHEIALGVKGKVLTIQTEAQTDCHPACENRAGNTGLDTTMIVDATGVAEDFIGTVDGQGLHPAGAAGISPDQLVEILKGAIPPLSSPPSGEPVMEDWQWDAMKLLLFKNQYRFASGEIRSLARVTLGSTTVANPYLGLFFDAGCGITHGTRANDFIRTKDCDSVIVYGHKGNDVIIAQGLSQAILGDSSETIRGNGNRPELIRESGSNLIFTYGNGARGDQRIVHGGRFGNNILEFGAGDILFSTNLHGWQDDYYMMDSFWPDDVGSWYHAFPMPSEGVFIYGDAHDELGDIRPQTAAFNTRTGEVINSSVRVACNQNPTDLVCTNDSPFLTFLWVYPFAGGPIPSIAEDFNAGRSIFESTLGNFEQCVTDVITGVTPDQTCSVDWRE